MTLVQRDLYMQSVEEVLKGTVHTKIEFKIVAITSSAKLRCFLQTTEMLKLLISFGLNFHFASALLVKFTKDHFLV